MHSFPTFAHNMGMLTLFLRAIFLDLFVLLIIRLVGKRQVSDLEPYDLLLTLIIADLEAAPLRIRTFRCCTASCRSWRCS